MSEIEIHIDNGPGNYHVETAERVDYNERLGFIIATRDDSMVLIDRGSVVTISGTKDDLDALISTQPHGFDDIQTRDAGDSDDPILDITPCPECGDADLIDSLGGIKRCPECGYEVEG